MPKTFTEKAKLVDKLRELMQQETAILHYACETFSKGKHLMSIAVFEVKIQQAKSFSVYDHCKGIKKATIKNNYEKYEAQMLTDFSEYFESKKDYNWICWNMKDDKFGFPHIKSRMQSLCPNVNFDPSTDKIYNLSHIAWELYGDDYVPGPKLQSLMTLNKISDRDFIIGEKEGKCFSKFSHTGYLAVNHSTLKKSEAIYLILQKMANESIKVHPNEEEILRLKRDQNGRWKFLCELFWLTLKGLKLISV